MVNFTIEQLNAMKNQDNIRNLSVIAHVDHGKSTLTDAILQRAGILGQNQTGQRFTDSEPDEIEGGITIKSTAVTMYYDYDKNNNGNKEGFIINLVDSPGHVDFSSEVTAALRITDGALVVVDAVEGVCVQTETVLRQACQEKIVSCLMINKLDRSIFEKQLDGEDIYQDLVQIIDKVNVILQTYDQEDMNSLEVSPQLGNVAFGSGKECWAFTLKNFARFYAKKFNTKEEVLMKKLWGDNYYNKNTKKWQDSEFDENGKKLKRGFVQFIMDPICKLANSCINNEIDNVLNILQAIDIKLTQEEQGQQGKALFRLVMQKWISAGETILSMVADHLPSPKQAQKYRTQYLYTGPQDNIAYSMKQCDPFGPLVVYVSKMVPNKDKSRFVAIARVFSGHITPGMKVKILGTNYDRDSESDCHIGTLGKCSIMVGKHSESVNEVYAGMTVGISGIDQHILKQGTIVDNIQKPYPIRNLKYSVHPVVRLSVEPVNAMDLPKLIEGVKMLSKGDPLLQVIVEETQEIIIAGSGELHVRIAIKDLERYAKCPIKIKDPIVSYRETISQESFQVCMVKTANKLNRFYGQAQPLDIELAMDIEEGKVSMKDDPKVRAKYLADNYKWDKDLGGTKLWAFGPENVGANFLVDQTKALQYVNEVRDSLVTGFQVATKNGVLCEEPLRGVQFNVQDMVLHVDPTHRRDNQVVPAATRLFRAMQLSASTKLQEPVYLCEITGPQNVLGGVYNVVNQRRAKIISEENITGTNLNILKCYIPVAETWNFADQLRGVTKGMAFPQCVFDHYAVMEGDINDQDNIQKSIINKIRARKGLKAEWPVFTDYNDKL